MTDEQRQYIRVTWGGEREIAEHDTVKRTYGHSREVIEALDNTPCETCGNRVGSKARGSRVCLDCLKAEIGA